LDANVNFKERAFFFNRVLTLVIVNKPEVSRTIAWSYGGLCIFIAAIAVGFALAGIFTPMQAGGIVSALVLVIVEAIMLLILRSLYTTKYVLTEHEIKLQTTRLIGGNKTISLKDVESVEETLIPFGVRLFGASFHGGYYEIPNLGKAFLAITNFNDGVLIKTKKGNYIITPKDPAEFKEAIEKNKNGP
jgi:hypothetical protein